jgi:hypothetical protein
VQLAGPKENQNIGFRCTTMPFDSSQILEQAKSEIPTTLHVPLETIRNRTRDGPRLHRLPGRSEVNARIASP